MDPERSFRHVQRRQVSPHLSLSQDEGAHYGNPAISHAGFFFGGYASPDRSSKTLNGTPGASLAPRITSDVFTLATFSAAVSSLVRNV